MAKPKEFEDAPRKHPDNQTGKDIHKVVKEAMEGKSTEKKDSEKK